MSKKEKKLGFLKKNRAFENIIIIFVGVVAIVLGILIFKQVINPEAYKDNKLVPILVILMGVIAIINGLSGQIKKMKYKNSVYFSLLDDYNNGCIKEKLLLQGLKNQDVQILEEKDGIKISISDEKSEISAVCFKQNVIFYFEYDEAYLEKLSVEDKNALLEEEYFESVDTLKLSLDEIYIKFSSMANNHF